MRAVFYACFFAPFFLFFSTQLYAANDAKSFSPQTALVPGGIAVIPLDNLFTESHEKINTEISADTEGHPVFISTHTTQAPQLIVGIPLSSSGSMVVNVHHRGSTKKITVPLADKKYPEQHITLPPDDHHVNPSDAELTRYAREAQEQQVIYKTFTQKNHAWPAFALPTQGNATPSFGLKRFFNGEPRAPHLGMDISAPEGQAVIAPADGVVVQTGDYFFNGRTVMIDHGQGLISMLCHLSRITVRSGETIKRGDKIGLVGHTGRATGPHLHWTVSLNDARIDPLLVLPANTETTAP